MARSANRRDRRPSSPKRRMAAPQATGAPLHRHNIAGGSALCAPLFWLLGGFVPARPAPRIVLLLGLGNALERGLVSLLVDLGLLVRLRSALVGCATAAPHLPLRRGWRHRQDP